jgi:hypothetical protein
VDEDIEDHLLLAKAFLWADFPAVAF